MKNEATFKSVFKKSVRAQGGYSISLAAPMVSGIPDLFITLPGFIPILLEAKFIKLNDFSFKRKIKYSALQVNTLKNCNLIRPRSAMGLIGIKIQKEIRAYLLHPAVLTVTDLTQPYIILEDKQFDVSRLFYMANIQQVNGTLTKENLASSLLHAMVSASISTQSTATELYIER